MALLEKYKFLMIHLQDIKSATTDFRKDKLIGGGGFGRVYKGEMPRRGLVAFKRLDDNSDQGEAEFWKEITTLSDYKHENLISLLGFCYEGREKILVYEYAFNGSLDRHLNSANLTWRQRLKICLQAAKALEYLHDPLPGTHERVIHCDIKTSNFLLDGEWNVKLSDFGLSKMGPANQAKSFLISAAVGTLGYCDPLYAATGYLTKESDVYSFGVVLFEVLLGRLCYEIINNEVQPIVHTWKESYEQNKLNEMVFRDLIMQIDQSAFRTYTEIAYRCLETFREKRPTMTDVVTELDFALRSQEISEGKEELFDYEEMTRTAEPPLKYRSKAELMILLSKGVLLNGGKTWLSLTETGGHCELIYIAACLTSESKSHEWASYDSLYFAELGANIDWMDGFSGRAFTPSKGKFKTSVRTQFLTPFITYTVNLVFLCHHEFLNSTPKAVSVKYKLEGESKTSASYLVDEREDGSLSLELYQFTCDRSIVNLDILFCGSDGYFTPIQIEGIEFRPMEMIEHKVSKHDGKKAMETMRDDSADAISWEEKLPADYQDIIKWSKDSVQWTTKKELYSILRNGFLINDGQEWFSLDTNGMKCLMLSARAVSLTRSLTGWPALSDPRFGEAYQLQTRRFQLVSKIKSQVLASQTIYAVYLVYKLPQEDLSAFKAPVNVTDTNSGSDDLEEASNSYFCLVSPQTPVIRRKADENTTHNPLSTPKPKGLPKERSDGWIEVQVWEFQTATTTDQVIPLSLNFRAMIGYNLKGLIVRGIEFRPI